MIFLVTVDVNSIVLHIRTRMVVNPIFELLL